MIITPALPIPTQNHMLCPPNSKDSFCGEFVGALWWEGWTAAVMLETISKKGNQIG
jgi:hypothetical protein